MKDQKARKPLVADYHFPVAVPNLHRKTLLQQEITAGHNLFLFQGVTFKMSVLDEGSVNLSLGPSLACLLSITGA